MLVPTFLSDFISYDAPFAHSFLPMLTPCSSPGDLLLAVPSVKDPIPPIFSYFMSLFLFFKYILLIMLLQLSHLPAFIPLCSAPPLPLAPPAP